MMKTLCISLTVIIIFSSCKGQHTNNTVSAERDTTITPVTAFSKLFLDSTKLESFIKENKMGDSITIALRNFYKRRNYQFAWFTEDGIAEHTRSFWNLHNNYMRYFRDTAMMHKGPHVELDALMNEDSTVHIDKEKMIQSEMQLTMHFFEYSDNAYTGRVDPASLQWYIPRKKINTAVLLDSFIARDGKDLQDWEPVNIFYKRLKKELIHYYDIKKAGGWKEITFEKLKKYNPGEAALTVQQVKQHLQVTGEYDNRDTAALYTPALIPAIKYKQKSFGLKQDGIINAAFITELNVPVENRIRQILINMERMRWVPKQPAGNFIIVNIPEYRMHIFEGEKKEFSIDVVAGKAANSTVIFAGDLKFVVFSPYWNVPPSIVRKEILPAMRRNPGYLSKKNMEQTGMSNGLPVIRQKPGGANSLGRVKFIFPNSYNIYFHDTPAKSLFKEESRAFSHGCIRVAEPQRLASYLLRYQPEWTEQAINDAMASTTEKWVPLKTQLPVFIFYFTSWVDSDGLLNFREDIYGHDKKLAQHLFE